MVSLTHRRVVITGRGVVSPLGIGIDEHREGLFSKGSSVRRSERLSTTGSSDMGAEVSDEALKSSVALIPNKQRKLMNRAGIFAAIAASFAVKDAHLEQGAVDVARLGISLATWFTAYDLPSFLRYLSQTESKKDRKAMDSEKANISWLEKMNPIDYSLKILPNLSAGHLAIFHQAQGGTRMIADGWRGGLLAVAQAADAIRDGGVDVVLAGGAEAPLEAGIFWDLSLLTGVDHDLDGARSLFCPFGASRGGLWLGEGAGVVVLEEREHALRRKAPIHGVITGSGSSAPGTNGDRKDTLIRSMKHALSQAEIAPDRIDLIHANGDSTLDNDRAEWQAIESVFGARVSSVPVTATKSLHGHLLSAAGAVELISCLLMAEQGRIAPIAGCDRPDPDCPLDLVRGSARDQPEIRAVLLNAVGLFGEAASLVFER